MGILGIIAFAVIFYLYVDTDSWKEFDPDKLINNKQTLYVYDKDGYVAAGIYNLENRTKISIADIPIHVRNAFIAAEDGRFYSHKGIDIRRIGGSIIANIKSRSFSQGFSTISQQLIKNSHLTTEKTLNRKFQEMYLAVKLEKRFSKDEILEMYLNFVYFGNGAYGIEAAAQSYFGKSTKELTISESALLAGILKGPGRYAPHIDLEKSINRRNLVIGEMLDFNLITQAQAQTALADVPNLDISRPANTQFNQYTDAALIEAATIMGVTYEDMASSGYKIYTALNSSLQSKAQSIFNNPDFFPPNADDGEKVQGAAVVLDSNTSAIVTLIGGRDYVNRGLNRATSSRRQPGSAIKPILVYAPAVDRFGYNGATILLDEQADFNGYTPRNYNNKYNGWVSMRYALAKSLNVPAVRTLYDIGIDSAKSTALNAGIIFDETDNNLSLALGGFKYGVTPLELAASYVPLSNGGAYNKPYFIEKIEDSYGNILYEVKHSRSQVIASSTAFMISDILKSAVNWGTVKNAAIDQVSLAGKTGTVSYKNGMGVNDAWTCLYTTDYVSTIWIGFDKGDDNHFMPTNSTGGNYPAKIAHELFAFAYAGRISNDFIKPDDVVLVALDKKSYDEFNSIVLAGEYTPKEHVYYEYFKKHNVPTDKTQYWDKPLPVTDIAVTLNNDNAPLITFVAPQSHIDYIIVRNGDGDDQLVELARISGETGTVYFVDTLASFGLQRYAVIPYHSEIFVDGQYLQGDISRFVEINIEFLGQIEPPSWQPDTTPSVSAPLEPSITPSEIIEPTPTESLLFPSP